jgi:tetratricopeptide (TPR) repeat protein
LVEVEKTNFEIKRTSKKMDANSVLTEKAQEIKTLKDKAYSAVQNGEHEVGISYYKQVLKEDQNDSFSKLSLATTYHTLGQYRQAKPLYVELLDVFPNSEQLVSNLLSVMIQETPYEAMYLIPGIAEKHDRSAIIQAQMSLAYAAVNKYPEAIKYIRKAIDLDPYNVDYKYNLAVFFDLSKNYKEAKKLYNEVLLSDITNRARSNDIKKRLSRM